MPVFINLDKNEGENSTENLSLEDFLSQPVPRQVHSLTIEDEGHLMNQDFLTKLASLHGLTSLTLTNCRLTAASLKSLAPSLDWSRLLELNLSDNPKLGPRGCQQLAEHLKNATQLRILQLNHVGMGHYGAQALAGALPGTLLHFSVNRNALEFDGVWKLCDGRLGQCTSLETLSLAHNQMGADGGLALVPLLSQDQWPSLQHLNISHNAIGDTGFEKLAPHMGRLQWLQAANNQLAASVRALKLAPHLQELDLSHNRIVDDECIAMVQALLPEDDSDSSDGDREPVAICLRKLNLSYNLIGDEGAGSWVEHLDAITTLQSLQLDGNDSISEARTRILDMLLKHRAPSESTRRMLVSTGRSKATLLPLKSLPRVGADTSAHGDEDDEEEAEDPTEAIEEAREILASLSLDSDKLHEVSMDYIEHVVQEKRDMLGYGAFGKLYGSNDDGYGILVRKVELHSAGAMQAVREKVLLELAALHHDNLTPILAYARRKHSYAFVYPGEDGDVSLRECLAKENIRQNWPWSKRISLLKSIAAGLDYLHLNQKFHGDIKPDNILVSDDLTTCRILDGGISRLVATDRNRFVPQDVVFGSRGYRCPRYERGSCQYDAASDIFSLGIVFAEIFTGRLQHSAGDFPGRLSFDVYYDSLISQKSIKADPLAGSIARAALDLIGKIILGCLSPNVHQRPSSSTVVQLLQSVAVQ